MLEDEKKQQMLKQQMLCTHLRVAIHPVFDVQERVTERNAWGPGWKEQLVKSPKVRENTVLLENLNKIQTACCTEKKKY